MLGALLFHIYKSYIYKNYEFLFFADDSNTKVVVDRYANQVMNDVHEYMLQRIIRPSINSLNVWLVLEFIPTEVVWEDAGTREGEI